MADTAGEKKVPNIRFKGFTDDWEQRLLCDVSKITMGQSPNSKNYTDNPNDHVLVQGNADLTNGQIMPRIWTKQVTKSTEKGDILLTVRAPVGEVAIANMDAVIGRGVASIKANRFVYYFLQTLLLKHTWDKLSSGSTFQSVSSDDIKNLTLRTPDTNEQNQLSNLMLKLERLLTLYQRKLDLLEQLKKGMLQKLFTDSNSKQPDLRFNGFNDQWMKVQLGDISSTTIGSFVIKTKQSDSSPYPVFNGGTTYTGMYDEFNNEGPKIVISARGANAGYVNRVYGKYWAGNSCYSVKLLDDKKYSIDYIFYFLKINQWLFTAYQQAANIPSVSKSDVEKFKVMIPKYDEQKQIANISNNIDNLISYQKYIIAKFTNLKKYLLQQMFI